MDFLHAKRDSIMMCDCGSKQVYHREDHYKLFQCPKCKNHFPVFKNTIFEKTRTDLRKWFYAMHLFLNGKKGISALQLQREIGVTYKCAWRMLHQVRKAMGNKREKTHFVDTIIEMDETFVGIKPRKQNKGRGAPPKRGRGTDKIPVVGIVGRSTKQIHAKVAIRNGAGLRLTGGQVLDILQQVAQKDDGNTIITDEFKSYETFSRKGYIHISVDHSTMFSDGDLHTNTIESFWAVVKPGVYGIYHSVSEKHLQKYIDEFSFRYNNRNDGFEKLLQQCNLTQDWTLLPDAA
jgi:transposase-like protein